MPMKRANGERRFQGALCCFNLGRQNKTFSPVNNVFEPRSVGLLVLIVLAGGFCCRMSVSG